MTENKEKKDFVARLNSLVNGKSKAEFSRMCDIQPSTMGGYLSGSSKPSLENLLKIAKRCGVTVAWLIGEVDDKNWNPGEVAATISPGDKKITLADKLPVNRITPLKLIVEWMNEAYDGELGEILAMQFYEDLKKNYPSFREYMEKKEKSAGHLDGPQENVSDGTDG